MTSAIEDGGRGMGGRGRVDWWAWAAWAGALALWLVPVVAELTMEEMGWGAEDFVVWAVMLATAAGCFTLASRAAGSFIHRAGAVLAIGTGFMLVWINLAVGFIGAEDHPANLMYAGVLLVAVAGALLARGRAAGMARAMLATAAAHGVVGAVALLAALDTRWVVTAANAIFVVLWLLSAALFRAAASTRNAD